MGTPWAQYKADLAVSRHDWWDAQRLAYLSWQAAMEAQQSAFEALAGAAANNWTSGISAANTAYVTVVTNANDAQTLAFGQADQYFIDDMAGGYQAYQTHMTAAQYDYEVSMAAAQRDLDAGGTPEDYAADVAAALAAYSAATKVARDEFAWTAAVADGDRRVARALATLSHAQAVGPAIVARAVQQGAAATAWASAYTAAQISATTNISNDTASYAVQKADSLLAAMDTFRTNYASPWATYTYDTVGAERDKVAIVAPATAARDIAVVTARAEAELATVAAENDHEEAIAQAESDEMIASAQAAYDNATATSQVEETMVTAVGLAGYAQSGGPDGLGYQLSEAWLTPLTAPGQGHTQLSDSAVEELVPSDASVIGTLPSVSIHNADPGDPDPMRIVPAQPPMVATESLAAYAGELLYTEVAHNVPAAGMVSGQFDNDDLATRLTGAIGDITGLWDQDNPDMLYLTAEAVIDKAVSAGRDMLPNSPGDAVNKFIDLDVRMNQSSSQLGWLRRGYRAFAEQVSDFSHLRANTELLSEYSSLGRWYVVGGTMLAIETGVRGVSDAGAEYDAVDGHKQGLLERWMDGTTGTIQLGATGFAAVGWAKGLGRLRTPGAGVAGRAKGFGDWFPFWHDRGGQTFAWRVINRRFLGPKYLPGVINKDVPGTRAYIDTAAHEAVHAAIIRHLPSVYDAGNLRIGSLPIGAPVKYLEEVLAYGVGHLRAGRIHGVPFSVFEPLLSTSLTNREKAVSVFTMLVGGWGIYEYYN